MSTESNSGPLYQQRSSGKKKSYRDDKFIIYGLDGSSIEIEDTKKITDSNGNFLIKEVRKLIQKHLVDLKRQRTQFCKKKRYNSKSMWIQNAPLVNTNTPLVATTEAELGLTELEQFWRYTVMLDNREITESATSENGASTYKTAEIRRMCEQNGAQISYVVKQLTHKTLSWDDVKETDNVENILNNQKEAEIEIDSLEMLTPKVVEMIETWDKNPK